MPSVLSGAAGGADAVGSRPPEWRTRARTLGSPLGGGIICEPHACRVVAMYGKHCLSSRSPRTSGAAAVAKCIRIIIFLFYFLLVVNWLIVFETDSRYCFYSENVLKET